jgi:hypothetical protein
MDGLLGNLGVWNPRCARYPLPAVLVLPSLTAVKPECQSKIVWNPPAPAGPGYPSLAELHNRPPQAVFRMPLLAVVLFLHP